MKKKILFVMETLRIGGAEKIAFMHTDYEAIPHDEKLDTYAYYTLLKCRKRSIQAVFLAFFTL